jgi:hypothetical protein
LLAQTAALYTSTDGAASFVDRTSGLGIREFYKIGVSKTNPNVVSGGSQDNGTSVMRGANRAWVDWLGADGMETFVSWNNANNLYGTSQNGSMYRSTNQGTTRSSISKPPDVEDGAWVTPFEQDPQISNTIYVAFADVWKTSNNGSDWTKISEFDNGNMNQMNSRPPPTSAFTFLGVLICSLPQMVEPPGRPLLQDGARTASVTLPFTR